MLKMEFSKNKDSGQGDSHNQEDKKGTSVDGEKTKRGNSGQFERLFGIKGEWKDLVSNLNRNTGLREKFPEIYDNINLNSGAKESYIFRSHHYEDIIVKEVFPTLSNIDKPFEQILQESPHSLEKFNERNEIIKKYRKWTEGEIVENRPYVHIYKNEKNNYAYPPLEFPKSSRQSYFNSTLRETKEKQLSSFINQFFNYDPNKGDLPVAVRELYFDNLQRIVYLFSPDPTYFYLDYFDENLNKEDFLKNSLYQAARLKGTKTQTELLFAVNDVYEIQQKAWQNYFDFEKYYNALPPEKKNNLRYETLHRVQQRYAPLLALKKIKNYQDAVKIYSKKRLEIIDYIIKNSPEEYRKHDALYEKGRIHWDLGILLGSEQEKISAIDIWKQIPSNFSASEDSGFIFKESIEKLNSALQSFDGSQGLGPLEGQIRNIIQNTHSKRIREKIEREEKILWPK